MRAVVTLSLCAAAVMMGAVAACSTVGGNFNEGRLSSLQPGQTTADAAAQLLGGPPAQVVWHDNKSATHIWRYVRATPAGVSQNKLLSLIFGPDGKLVRVGQLVNVPLNDEDRLRLRVMGESTIK